MPAEVMIQCEGLTKRFDGLTAVDHVSFSVAKRSIFGFLGPNGSGKTTVIRMLCGILEPSEGRAEIAGFDVTRQTDQIKGKIGYMSQKFSLYDELTANENLMFYGRLYGLRGPVLKQRRDELVALTHLEPYLDRRAASAFRRLAAAAGDGLRAGPQAQRPVPGRTDRGDRPGGAARTVGFAV